MMPLFKNQENTILYINDEVVFHRNSTLLLVFFNITNATLNCVKVPFKNFGYEQFIWVFIALASIIIMFFNLKKRDFSKRIKINEIKNYKIKNVLNRSYTLVFFLKNGKQRNVIINKKYKDETNNFLESIKFNGVCPVSHK